jgi:hypothetical protein
MAAGHWRETEHAVIQPRFQRTCEVTFAPPPKFQALSAFTALMVRLKYVEAKAERAIHFKT